MRKLFLTAVVAGLAAAALLLAACKATDTAGNQSATTVPALPAQPASAGDNARRVTITELQKMLENGEAVVYDTRSKGDYDTGHIKGALSLPLSEVESRTGELPKDKLIVFYCA